MNFKHSIFHRRNKVVSLLFAGILMACSSSAVQVSDFLWEPSILSKEGCPANLSGNYANAAPQNADEMRFIPEPIAIFSGTLRQGSYISPVETVYFAQIGDQWVLSSRVERPRYSGMQVMSIEEVDQEDAIARRSMSERVDARKKEIAAEKEIERRTGARKPATRGVPLDQLPGMHKRNADASAMTLSLEQKEDSLVYETHWSDGRLAMRIVHRLNTPAVGCRAGALILRTTSTLPAREASGSVSFGEAEVRKLGDGSLQITMRSRVQLVDSISGQPVGSVAVRPTVTRIYPAVVPH